MTHKLLCACVTSQSTQENNHVKMEQTYAHTHCTQHIKGFMQKDELENLIRSLTELDKVISGESHEKAIGVFGRKI